MVTDHYNATQQKLVFDDQEEETRSGRPGRRGAVDSEEEAGHVTATSNQARLACMRGTPNQRDTTVCSPPHQYRPSWG